MKKSVSIALIIGGALAFVGSILFLISLFLMNFDFNNLTIPQESPLEVNREFSDEIRSIVINDSTANISISKSYDDDACYVSYPDGTKRYHLATVKDGVLTIEEIDNRTWKDHIFFGITPSTPSYVSIFLPEGEYESLSIYASTGTIYVGSEFTFNKTYIDLSTGEINYNAKTVSELTLDVTTGDITIKDVSVGETATLNVKAKSTTGEIIMDSIVAKSLNAKTSTGGIHMSKVLVYPTEEAESGTMNLGATTGDISLNYCQSESFVSNSSSGDIEINNSTVTNADINTSSGNVEISNSRCTNLKIETSSGRVNGSLLNKPIFITNTSSGTIKIPKELYGTEGTCEVNTSSGNITFKAPNQ